MSVTEPRAAAPALHQQAEEQAQNNINSKRSDVGGYEKREHEPHEQNAEQQGQNRRQCRFHAMDVWWRPSWRFSGMAGIVQAANLPLALRRRVLFHSALPQLRKMQNEIETLQREVAVLRRERDEAFATSTATAMPSL